MGDRERRMMMHHMKPHRDDRYHDFHHHRHPMEDKGGK